VNVQVDLGHAWLTLDDILGLQKDDVIILDTPTDKPLQIFVEGIPKFTGVSGTLHGNKAIKISEIVKE